MNSDLFFKFKDAKENLKTIHTSNDEVKNRVSEVEKSFLVLTDMNKKINEFKQCTCICDKRLDDLNEQLEKVFNDIACELESLKNQKEKTNTMSHPSFSIKKVPTKN